MSTAAATGRARARVLIAADHDATRKGMRLALGESAECSEAGDAAGAVDAALRERPDVCFVDFSPPGRGIRAAAEITAKVPDASVVVMTDRIDEDEFLSAIQAGASGYVSQQIDLSRLPYLIQGVMRGEAAVPRMMVTRLLEELRGRERRRVALRDRGSVELTQREWQVAEGVRRGLTTREVANRLGIAEVTVRRHISGVRQKVGVQTRAELLELLGGSAATDR